MKIYTNTVDGERSVKIYANTVAEAACEVAIGIHCKSCAGHMRHTVMCIHVVYDAGATQLEIYEQSRCVQRKPQ